MDWSTVERGNIGWYTCADEKLAAFDCGRLIVPLNYANSSLDHRNASIALIRHRAGNGTTPRDEVRGSILFNPGGPGGSGISLLTQQLGSPNITKAQDFDNTFDGLFDIVSFDPRGVGETQPRVKCFDNEDEERSFQAFGVASGVLGAHADKGVESHEFGAKIVENHFYATMCNNHGNNSELLRFMGTVAVCRDLRALHQALGDTHLNYWGFSYGTVIGSVYADMFPEDVGHLVLDGVVDVPNYLQGLWSHNMLNTEDEWRGFFSECQKAGPGACRLAALNSSSAESLRNEVESWLNGLRIYPLSAVDLESPRIVSWSEVMGSIFTAMYKVESWPSLADDLYNAVALGNTTGLAARATPFSVLSLEPAIFAIACGDTLSDPSGDYTVDEYKKHYFSITDDSMTFARFFADLGPMCRGAWPVRASQRHHGNLTAETRFPLLTLGNDYDPVTPARYADEAAQRFGGVSVRRGGYGHCSGSMASNCIKSIVHDYFVLGKLPEAGSRCEPDNSPFPASGRTTTQHAQQVFPLIL